MRGGSWNSDAHNCRSANRNNNRPDNRNNNVGFRLSSSRQRPDAVYSRIPRLCQGTDPMPRTCSPLQSGTKMPRPAAVSRP